MPYNESTSIGDMTVHAEENLLGAIMLGAVTLGDPDLVSDVRKVVSPEDFADYKYHGDRSRIYEAIINCTSPEVVLVTYELFRTNKLKKGDPEYLQRLLLTPTTSYNYMEYARIVRELSARRNPQRKETGIEIGSFE